MSLLNEALRKSRAKEQSLAPTGFRPGKAVGGRKFIIPAIIVVAAAAAGFAVLIWARHSRFPEESSGLQTMPQEIAREMAPTAADSETLSTAETAAPGVVALEIKTPDSPAPAPVKKVAGYSHAAAPKKNIGADSAAKQEAQPEKADKVEEPADAGTDRFFQKALQLHRDGRLVDAIAIYQDILKQMPDNYDAVCNLSSAYIELSDFSSAYSLLNRYQMTNADDARLLLNLAVAETGLGREMDAIDHLNRINVEDEDLNFKKYFHLGVASGRLGKSEEALVFYRHAEEIRNNHPGLLYNLAILYDRSFRYDEALDYYSRYLSAGPSTPDEAEAVRGRIKILQAYVSGSVPDSGRPN